MRLLVILVGTMFALGSNVPRVSALPQRGVDQASNRKTLPTGAEIAAAARGETLDHSNAGTATMFGKPFKFTPTKPKAGEAKSLEAGAFVGVLENGAGGDETGLPAGKYNVFVAKVNGQWSAYAEAGGQVVRRAVRANVSSPDGVLNSRPRFSEKGWCINGWWMFAFRHYGQWNVCF